MKDWKEIPECMQIINEMFEKCEKIPCRPNGKDLRHEKAREEIEKVYLKKLRETYNKYKQEHPEEFVDENK